MSRQFLPKGTKVMCQETVKYSTVLCPPAPTTAHLTLKDKQHLGKQASNSVTGSQKTFCYHSAEQSKANKPHLKME